MWKGYTFNGKYTKIMGIFLSNMVYKRVRGWTSGPSLPVQNFVEYTPRVYLMKYDNIS